MSGCRRCKDTCQHLTACFIKKQVRLGFPSFASKLAKEQRRVVHMASLETSCGSEAEVGRFDGIRCDTVEVRPKYPFLGVISISAHRGILVFWMDL
jgi:hypothetical protein